jgi:hypothetical protein
MHHRSFGAHGTDRNRILFQRHRSELDGSDSAGELHD